MSDPKEEWEIGYSQETPVTPPIEVSSPDFARSATLLGQLLDGRFMIEKDLTDAGADHGGIGLVYLARDLKLMGREVVVKILQKDALQSTEMLRKFQHEKEALIRLDHPNIVRILDSGTLSDGNPFTVMEYIAGRSLRRMLRDGGPLSLELAAHIAESIGGALGAAHSQRVLHRDIKPENIMLTPLAGSFDQVKLIDFGIARVEQSRLAPQTSISGRASGTLKYIAPEQLSGTLEQTSALDIYSFAIVVFEMLTGSLPFSLKAETLSEAIIEMYEAQKVGVTAMPTSLRPDLPKRVEEILLSGLEYDPARRPQDAVLFGKDLSAALRRASSRTIENPVVHGVDPTQLVNLESVQTVEKKQEAEADPIDSAVFKVVSTPDSRSKKPLLWASLALLILTALAIPAGIVYWNQGKPATIATVAPADTAANANANSNTAAHTNANSNLSSNANTAAPPAGTPHELSYFMTVQKMGGGKPVGAPFKSSGMETFDSGDKFSLAFQPDADGYIYVFNEGMENDGSSGYFILYPTPKVKGGSAKIGAKQLIETARNTFGGAPGTEVMWVIWTKDRSADLETVKDAGFTGNGSVKDPGRTKVLADFLASNNRDKNAVTRGNADQPTIVKATGDVVVHRFELMHK